MKPIAAIVAAHGKGQDVARVHSGDPSLYGAIAEQIRRLKADGIPFEIVPGVPAYAAAARRDGSGIDDPRGCAIHRFDPDGDENRPPMPEEKRWRIRAHPRNTLLSTLVFAHCERLSAC